MAPSHHLGFHQCDHQKGVYFDGHEQEDVVTYQQEFLDQLASLDETMITPTRPMPAVADGERRLLTMNQQFVQMLIRLGFGTIDNHRY